MLQRRFIIQVEVVALPNRTAGRKLEHFRRTFSRQGYPLYCAESLSKMRVQSAPDHGVLRNADFFAFCT